MLRFLVDREDDVKKQVSSLKLSVLDVEAQLADARNTLPAAVLANLIVPGIAASPHRAGSPTSTQFHSAAASAPTSPSLVPVGGFEPRHSTGLGSPYQSPGRPRAHTTASSTSGYPHGDYYEDGRPLGDAARRPSTDPYTPPHPPSRSQLSLVSQSGSPVLPIPRAVSPLALSPMDPEGNRGFSREGGPAVRRRELPTPGPQASSSSDWSTPHDSTAETRQSSDSLHAPQRGSSPQPPSRSSTTNSPLAVPSNGASPSGITSGRSSVVGSPRNQTPSPTPRKRYTVALSGRISPSPSLRPSVSPSTAPAPIAGRSSFERRPSGDGKMKVETAVFTDPASSNSYDYNFDSTGSMSRSTSSLADSLKFDLGGGGSGDKKTASSVPTSAEPSPPSKKPEAQSDSESEEEFTYTSRNTGSGSALGIRGNLTPPTEEEEEEEDSPPLPPPKSIQKRLEDAALEQDDEDEDEDNSMTIGSTPIALKRIVSPPSSPTPRNTLKSSRGIPLRSSISQGTFGSPSGNNSASSSTTSLSSGTIHANRAVSPTPTPAAFGPGATAPLRTRPRSASPTKGLNGVPRSFGGLGSGGVSTSKGGVMMGSLSSINSAVSSHSATSDSSATSATSDITSSSAASSSSAATGSSSGMTRSSYRTTMDTSPPNRGPLPQAGRQRAQTSVTPLQRSSPLPTIPAGGSPTSNSDRERDVFVTRSWTSGGGGPLSASSTSSSSSFVDPLERRKKEVERRSMEVKAVSKAVASKATAARAPGKKPPVGELVAYFQAVQD